jgi:hypothetical protein
MSLARWVGTLVLVLLVSTVSVKANSIYYDITDQHHDSIASRLVSSDSGAAFASIDPLGSGFDSLANFNNKDVLSNNFGNGLASLGAAWMNELGGSVGGSDGHGSAGDGSSSDDFARLKDRGGKDKGGKDNGGKDKGGKDGGGKGDGILNGWSNGNDPQGVGLSQSSPVRVPEPRVLTLIAACMVAAGVLLLKRSAED